MIDKDLYKINANPTKEFFIRMLTRDIDLHPAIAELVDNSIDAAKKFRKVTNQDLFIEVTFDAYSFTIKDNCGGMTIADARDYCFRFGRESADVERSEAPEKGIGVFGIGMKRALFRMGNEFEVRSKTPQEHFSVHVDVDEWMKESDKDWSFSFSDLAKNESNDYNDCGTEIVVKRLHKGVGYTFSSTQFRNSFFEYLKTRSTAIKGLNVSIIINGKSLEALNDKILLDDKYQPYVSEETIDGVKITVVAGCSKMGDLDKAGWYILCNNRMIVYASQGDDTIWSSLIRKFHPSFATFRGYVFFESEDLEKLPWNTTKTGVDMSSKYYIAAQQQMISITKEYIKFRENVDHLVEGNECLTPEIIFRGDECAVLGEKFMEYISEEHDMVFPELNADNFPLPPKPLSRISFTADLGKVDKIKKKMGLKTNKLMGEKIFQYYYEREIREDE